MLNHPALILSVAFVLDLLIGDPVCPLHPVRLFGHLINGLEKILRNRFIPLWVASRLLPLLTVTLSLFVWKLLHALCFNFAWMFNLLTAYSLLALRDLSKHAKKTGKALQAEDLPTARNHVQMMAGRDASVLDSCAVARAAIESVAENFVDGFLSPVFWYTVGALLFNSTEGGVAFLIIFKIVSTLDSMVGYKNEKYNVLGRTSARLDDILNWLPARLSIPLIALASRRRKEAWRTGLRDRLKHASPNSAHAEAAMAGALKLCLGGPTVYSHGTVDKPWLGDGSPDASPDDLFRAVRLVTTCGILALLLSTALLFI